MLGIAAIGVLGVKKRDNCPKIYLKGQGKSNLTFQAKTVTFFFQPSAILGRDTSIFDGRVY